MQKWIDIRYRKPEEGQWITVAIRCYCKNVKSRRSAGKNWFSFKTFSYDPSHRENIDTVNFYSINGKGTYTQQITHWVPVLDPP